MYSLQREHILLNHVSNIWCQCILATSTSQQLQYLLQVCNGLLQILGLLEFLLPDHVLLFLV